MIYAQHKTITKYEEKLQKTTIFSPHSTLNSSDAIKLGWKQKFSPLGSKKMEPLSQ